jgi:hypothetical protein
MICQTGLNDILAEFESHWIGRSEGAHYLPAERPSSATSSPAWCEQRA